MATRRFEGTADLVRNGGLRRLLGGQLATVAAVYGLSLAGVVLVEEETRSSAGTGLVIVSSILPAFLFSLFAGAVVDRRGRRRLLLAAHGARMVLALCFWAATGFLPAGPAIVALYVANALTAAATQFATPAEQALLPDLVARPRLAAANALYQVSMIAGEGLGVVALAPLIVKAWGVPAMGLVSAALCALALLLIAGLPAVAARAPSPVAGPAREPAGMPATAKGGLRSAAAALVADVRDGWRAIAADRLLALVAVQATIAATLLLVLLSLLPGLVSRTLALGVEDAPYIILAGGAGFLLGAAWIGRRGERLDPGISVAAGLLGVGVSTVVLALVAGPGWQRWASVAAIAGVGLALSAVVIPARVALQRRPPAALRARVIGAQLALANAASVLPLLLGGAVADWLGIRPVMVALGAVALLAGTAGLAVVRRQRAV